MIHICFLISPALEYLLFQVIRGHIKSQTKGGGRVTQTCIIYKERYTRCILLSTNQPQGDKQRTPRLLHTKKRSPLSVCVIGTSSAFCS